MVGERENDGLSHGTDVLLTNARAVKDWRSLGGRPPTASMFADQTYGLTA
jgi:hypothetical protein